MDIRLTSKAGVVFVVSFMLSLLCVCRASIKDQQEKVRQTKRTSIVVVVSSGDNNKNRENLPTLMLRPKSVSNKGEPKAGSSTMTTKRTRS